MADDIQSFEFKPALMRGRDNWTLDGGFLTKNGELFCDLGRIESARFAEMASQRVYTAWLDLYQGDGRHRIACNLRRPSEHNQQFMSLAASVLENLAAREPDMPVAFGAGSGVRWAMFLIGLLAGLFGLGLWASVAMGGTAQDETLFVLLFGGLFVVFGAGLGWAYRPWAPPRMLSASAARDLVRRFAANAGPQKGKDQGEDPEQDKG
ncbi:hypothetical protein [Henriciella aquimarina]|uniref:hypothetical protein n=1 Tax=Henriciella aquimarina TaxID=545261 RepID=UPI000A0299F4|nr:hypothetical protein [Henriciella aquimarina]